ncbi:hypothetical protein ACWCV5_28290 [Streptomyces tubercidicus]
MTMTPARARATRLPQLTADVQAGSHCTTPQAPEPGEWFRAEGESLHSWATRRQRLLRFCEGCPVLAQCREIALRLDTELADDDMVRGAMTAEQLYKARRSKQHRRSLNRAIAADRSFEASDAERNRIAKLTEQLRHANLSQADPRVRKAVDSNRPSPKNTVAEATAAVHELRTLRTARRERTGWAKRPAA